MENQLRAALVEWLRGDAALANLVNAVTEEAPSRATAPWLGIAASASNDWSTKDRKGREVRVAFELRARSDDAVTAGAVVRAIDARIEALPRDLPELEVANVRFLRARAEQQRGNQRTVLLEYGFRVLAA